MSAGFKLDESTSRTLVAETGLPDLTEGVSFDATITPDQLLALRSGTQPTIAHSSAETPQLVSGATEQLPSITLSFSNAGEVEEALPGQSHDLQVVRLLGEGGMGRVYLATQRILRRDVAIKTLKTEFADAHHRRALLSEAILTGSLEHPNIVPVHALGRDEANRPLLVMKKIDGVSWETLLCESGHSAWEPLTHRHGDRLLANIEILLAVCDAVHFAHTRGVLHRDIKPENVMVGSHGEVYLVDWGIATELKTQDTSSNPDSFHIVGTPSYMAPEMVVAEMGAQSPATDVYLLGATLHRVLSGQPPHQAPSLHGVLGKALLSAPVEHPSTVSPEMTALCHHAMARDPAQRIASARAFRERLVLCVAHLHSVAMSRAARENVPLLQHHMQNEDPVALATLATETRFAFRHALREWPENPDALAGQQECLEMLFAYEIKHQHRDAAAALLAEMTAPKEPHRQALQTLDESLANAEKERDRLREGEQRLQALEHDLDEAVSAKQRLYGVGSVSVLLLALAANSVRRSWLGDPVTTREATLTAVALSLVVFLIALVARKALFGNTVNRRFSVWGMGFVTSLLVHRVVAWRHGLSAQATFGIDFVLIALQFGLAGELVSKIWRVPFSVVLPFLVASWIWPEQSPPLFAVGSAMGLSAMTLAMYRRENASRNT